MAQDKPHHKKPLIRDCCNHKGSFTLFKPYLTIAAGISSSSFIWVSMRQLAVSSLSKGLPSTFNINKSTGTDRTRTRTLSHWKWTLIVSIDLTWLLTDFTSDTVLASVVKQYLPGQRSNYAILQLNWIMLFCYAPVLHWFYVRICSIMVQDR